MNKPQIFPWNSENIEEAIYSVLDNNGDAILSRDDELTNTMVSVVSRMTEKTTERTNRLAEKAALDFYSMAGKSRILPNPATVPVKFTQTATKEETVVPQYTQVSTLASDMKEPIIFETTTALNVAKPDLKRFVVVDPERSRYEDKSNLIEKILEVPEKLYNTDTPLQYDLHLHHPVLDEIDSSDYWVQLILEFDPSELQPATSAQNLDSIISAAAISTQEVYGQTVDHGLLNLALSYLTEDNRAESIPLKVKQSGINNIGVSEHTVYTMPIQLTGPLAQQNIGGFSNNLGMYNEATERFLTLTMEINNREFLKYYEVPKIRDVKLKLYYRPALDSNGELALITNEEKKPIPVYSPEYRDTTNIEQAFFNDKKIDLSKPFKPFGDTPKTGDTFSFSSRFFALGADAPSNAPKMCQINLWMMGDLSDSIFSGEQADEHKVYCPDVLLGWEYFDGTEWQTLATTEYRANYSSPAAPDEYGDCEVLSTDVISEFDFNDGSQAFTRSAHFAKSHKSNKYPTIRFNIPDDISQSELNGINGWWIRIRILRGGSFNRPLKQDNYGRIIEQPIIAAPFFRTFSLNFSNISTVNPVYNDKAVTLYEDYFGVPAASCTSILMHNGLSMEIHPTKINPDTGERISISPLLNPVSKTDGAGRERILFLGFSGEEATETSRNLFFSIKPDLSMILPMEFLQKETNDTGDLSIGYLTTTSSSGSIDLIPEFEWEYWNGNTWKPIHVTDRTEGLTSAQSIEFTIPADAQKSPLFGDSLKWIRGSIPEKKIQLPLFPENANDLLPNKVGVVYTNCVSSDGVLLFDIYDTSGTIVEIQALPAGQYSQFTRTIILNYNPDEQYYRKIDNKLAQINPYCAENGVLYYLPLIEEPQATVNEQLELFGINQNMVLAESFETVTDEILGSSTGEPSQEFAFVGKPIAAHPRIQIRENDIVTSSEYQLIQRDESGSPAFYSVPDVQEREQLIREKGFEDTATVIQSETNREIWVEWQEVESFIHSTPTDRHYVVDHVNGVIHFGDGVNGRIPDAASRNIKAAFYRYGGGKSTNIEIGEIRNLISSIPYISGVNNLSIAKGGDDLEEFEEIIPRTANDIAAFGRAVTASDYEAIALASTGGIHRVRAYPGLRPDGIHEQGWITLVVVASQKGERPLPDGEFMKRVENYLADHCSSVIVNAKDRFNPIKENSSAPRLKQLAVVPPNYVTTWVEASLQFKNEQAERTMAPQVSRFISTYLHARTGGETGNGWEFGRDVYISEISRVLMSVPGVEAVKQVRLKANQMRFALPINAHIGETLPAGSLVTTEYYKPLRTYTVEDEPINLNTVNTFTFSMVSALPIEKGDTKVVVEGFKEGDIISLKTLSETEHEPLNLNKREKLLGRSRVTAVETHFFDGVVEDEAGVSVEPISHYRIHIQPLSMKRPGSSEITFDTNKEDKLSISNEIHNSALIVAESLHSSFPLTGESKPCRFYIAQIVSANGTLFRRSIEGTDYELRHLSSESIKTFEEMGDEEIVAIDIAIPNLWGTLEDEKMVERDNAIPPISIFPHGIEYEEKQSQPSFKMHSVNTQHLTNYNNYDFVETPLEGDEYLLIPEYTEQIFLGEQDLPAPGQNRIISDILLSEGENIVAKTDVENTTKSKGVKENHLWIKGVFKEAYSKDDEEINRSVVSNIHSGAEFLISKLADKPYSEEKEEELRILNLIKTMSRGEDIANTTDNAAIVEGAIL